MAVSKVAVIRGKGVLSSGGKVNMQKLSLMFKKGFQIISGEYNLRESMRLLFNVRARIGIKINTISGKRMSTLPETSLSLARVLKENGFQEDRIFIWDRTNRELKAAGYRLNLNRKGIKIFGTDTDGVGYKSELVSHLNIGSIFSAIQSRFITESISLAVLKDHGLAGITAGMKNYYGAIHNPNKYHDSNCNPFVAELFDTKYIKPKHKLTILDCLLVQFHRGPAYHPSWAKTYETLVFSTDPVAADFVGWKIIEELRAEKGLPSLKEEEREPKYLMTGEKMGLGNANQKSIQIIEELI